VLELASVVRSYDCDEITPADTVLVWGDLSIFVPCGGWDAAPCGASSVAWLSLTPDFVVALLYLFAPGLLVARTLGLRGIFLWAAAPAVSMAIVGGSALLGQLVGLRWNFISAGLGTLLAMAAAIALTRSVGRQPSRSAAWVLPQRSCHCGSCGRLGRRRHLRKRTTISFISML
jgi:hypothetical protein